MTNFFPDRPALMLVALAAAVISSGLIVLLRPLLQRYALARPNARSSHAFPTPQGAGIAVIAATLAVAGVAASMMGLGIQATLFAATLFIALVGFADDIRPIPAPPRLLLQATAVGAVILATPVELRIAPVLPLAVERGLLLLALVWFVNLVNFMDGLDLMTAAEVMPIAGALVLLGWLGDFPAVPTIIAAALGGAMLGFAPFNRPIAKVFLGDVGSLPIGLLLGWSLLQLAWHDQLVAALLLPLYYITDATLTLVLRIIRGEPFWAAHRGHFYQRATDNGFTVPRIVGEVFALNVALVALALTSIEVNSTSARIVSLIVGTALVALLLYRFSTRKLH
jgi:UDP-N-acetylmuramyl pentapeptide phosphotransferase/UDP-N-acetylglucosamine-1-phosphate transferase